MQLKESNICRKQDISYFGTVYNEKICPIGEIGDGVTYADDEKTLSLNKTFEFSFETKINKKAYLTLIVGRKITNNYLKLHGGVMSRRWIK